MAVYFFQPIAKYTIWGGTACNDYFNMKDFTEGVGQVWAFSAQENDSTMCLTPPYAGMTLLEMWHTHPELFLSLDASFPVIVSLVAPEAHLSIQVHPNRQKAGELGYPMGKNEAWYFIQSPPESSIVYGQTAKSEDDVRSYIREGRWSELVRKRPVAEQEFVYIPAGMLHALSKGNIVYEVQQATDITYRFYDYDRVDGSGNKRQLHLEEAISCLDYSISPEENTGFVSHARDGYAETVFIRNDSFTVSRLEVNGEAGYHTEPYRLATVVKGEGWVDGLPVRTGSSFLIPAGKAAELAGIMTIMMTTKE